MVTNYEGYLMLICDKNHLIARIYHGLKSLFNDEDTLPPRYLEYSLCKSFGLDHVGDGNFYADGIKDDVQVSIKTRMISPTVLKTQQGRDFQTHPSKFLGAHQNVKHNRWTAGLELVQRRQALDFDDTIAPPDKVGVETVSKFLSNIVESYGRYKTKKSYELIVVHGYNRKKSSYLLSLFWQEYKPLDPSIICWFRESNSVSGYITVDSIPYKICERINGNAKREATCFKEYKDPTTYENTLSIEVPIPEPWIFDQAQILTEIENLKGPTNDHLFLFEQ